MFHYAQLNNDNICIGISSLTGEIELDNMILIPTYDQYYLWRKFENGQWSEQKFMPEPTPNNPNELELLKNKVQYLEEHKDEHEAALIEMFEILLSLTENEGDE